MALVDPTTGLPNSTYLQLVWDWEQRRAERTGESLQVVTLSVTGGDDSSRRMLAQRLPLMFRRSDLVACGSARTFHLLCTRLPANHVHIVQDRVDQIARHLNQRFAGAEPITIRVVASEDVDSPIGESAGGRA
jgi:hypothetical protein